MNSVFFMKGKLLLFQLTYFSFTFFLFFQMSDNLMSVNLKK